MNSERYDPDYISTGQRFRSTIYNIGGTESGKSLREAWERDRKRWAKKRRVRIAKSIVVYLGVSALCLWASNRTDVEWCRQVLRMLPGVPVGCLIAYWLLLWIER